MRTKKRFIIIAATFLLSHGTAARAQTNWLTFGFDQERTGYNPQETILSPQTVPALQFQWSVYLGAPMTAQPVEANGLLYAATLAGMLYALDPSSGSVVWSVQLGTTSVPPNCTVTAQDGTTVGIIGTPTIDLSNGRIFVVSGDDLLHALDPGTGNELSNYPLQLMGQANNAPRTIVYGSPTYNTNNNSLYLATASGCDNPPYHGQVMRVDVTPNTPPRVRRRWFPDGSSGPDGGGIWGPGGLSLGPYSKALYVATGNASTDPENYGYADKVVRLGLDLSVHGADGPNISGGDLDFGSTPVLYQTPGCPPQLAALNKNGALYVYNRDAIGSGPLQVLQISGQQQIFIGDVAYDSILNQVYTGNTADDGVGIFNHGIIALAPQPDCTLGLAWQQSVGPNGGDNYPPVIPPMAANGVVYYATGDGSSVFAFDGTSGQYLWDTGGLAQGGVLASPTVINGQLFVADFSGNLTAFGLAPSTLAGPQPAN
jgi:outer membrane protein assembly factor BamB